MSAAQSSERAMWIWAWTGALVVSTITVFLFRVPKAAAPAQSAAKVAVAITSSSLLRDEAIMFDPAPLFLPTRLNAAPSVIEMPEFGAAFPNYFPKFEFEVSGLKLDVLALPKPVAEVPSPASAPGAVLVLPPMESLAGGFGRADLAVPNLVQRGGYVTISAAETGRIVLAEELAESVRPLGSSPWQPLEFAAAVDPAGLVGALVLTTRSGAEEVDAHFQNYLARSWRIGERLAPGFYRICVGP